MSVLDGVVVQVVRVSWTKASRGGPGAAARNAVPLGPPLPGEWTMGTLHHVVFDEADDFTPRSRCVPLEWLDDRIQLTEREGNAFAQVDALPFGFTQRGNHPTVPLRPGRWVRWLQNARWSSATGHGDWRYTAETVNIAIGSAESDVFTGEPGKTIDERVNLR